MARPKLAKEKVAKILEHRNIKDRVAIVGLRGYYLDSKGEAGANDRGIYDDALFVVVRDSKGQIIFMQSYNANTDPSVYRKGIATLKTGTWRYQLGIHGVSKPKSKQYLALRQAEAVIVSRDGQKDERGWFGINIHRGGYNTTSSLGCQTIYPSQWEEFISIVKNNAAKNNQTTIPYVLMNETDRRKFIG